MTFEEVLQKDIGPLGKWQLLCFALIMITAEIPVSMIPQLANLAPNHVCTAPWFDNWTYNDVFNFSSTLARLRSDSNVTASPDFSCQRFDLSSMAHALTSNRSFDAMIEHAVTRNLSLESCPGSWLFDATTAPYRRSLIEDFQLVCARKALIPNSMMFYAAGMALGQMVGGQLSDRFGRLMVSKVGNILLVIELVVISFCSSVWAFFPMRFVLGATSNAAYVASITMYIEITDDKHRVTLNFLHGFICDFVSAPLIVLLSFLIQDWRFVHVAAGVFILGFTLSQFLLLQESPRWLTAKGRYTEALQVVRRAIRMNTGQKKRAAEISVQDLKTSVTTVETSKGCGAVFRDWIDLFRTPGNLRRLLPLAWIWISVTMTFYTVSFFAVRLDGNPYFIAVVMLWIGAPSHIVKFFLAAKLGRKVPLLIMLLASGIFLVTAFVAVLFPAAPELIAIVMATIGLSLVSTAFGFIYMYTPELFTTVQRSKALGFCSFCARFGMIAGSFVERLDELVWRPLPLLICATVISLAALASLFLPSDDHRTLRDTATEEEDVGSEKCDLMQSEGRR